MKLFIFFIILVLTGCSKSFEVNYISGTEYSIYAINENSNNIELIYVDYVIEDCEDIFNLYTINQNYLPIGYTSNVGCNITLIAYEIKNNVIYYEVDNYILVENYNTFNDLLSKSCKLLGYNTTHIILNSKQLI